MAFLNATTFVAEITADTPLQTIIYGMKSSNSSSSYTMGLVSLMPRLLPSYLPHTVQNYVTEGEPRNKAKDWFDCIVGYQNTN